LSYGELAAMEPRAGGQYVFLREAFGPFWGFLYGWTLFLVIQTGFNAAVSIAFGKFLGIFLPSLGEANVLLSVPLSSPHVEPTNIASAMGQAGGLPLLWQAGWNAETMLIPRFEINTAQLVACGVILLLTGINMRGVREGA